MFDIYGTVLKKGRGMFKFLPFCAVGMSAWKIYGFVFKQSPIFPRIKSTQFPSKMCICNDFTSVNICHKNPLIYSNSNSKKVVRK